MTLLASLFVDHADTIRFLADITERDDGANGTVWTIGKRIAAICLAITVVGFVARVTAMSLSKDEGGKTRNMLDGTKNFALAIGIELGAYAFATAVDTVQTGVLSLW